MWKMRLGANPEAGGTRFLLWAPMEPEVFLKLTAPDECVIPMEPRESGYHEAMVPGIGAGARYFYLLAGGRARPDPASRAQPEGVHGPSEVVDPDRFDWKDSGWGNHPLDEYIIYELHVGAFTPGGSFDEAASMLSYLKKLGVTAVELMPVAQFPGERNWGYDGAYPYAPHNSYGGPEGLKRFVRACHQSGIAVVLDVVYNHLGPEGNYLSEFGFYFTGNYKTPWGQAVNYDGPWSDEVRRYFIENALYWFSEYRIDALRLDAIHGIFDESPRHFLEELRDRAEALGREMGKPLYVMVESDRNDIRVIREPAAGGYGIHAHWNDDFHHALHALLTGEKDGYYQDFGGVEHMAKAFREGFVYTGEFSRFRMRRHGSPSAGEPPGKFIVFSQNHDQVGNRLRGDRLSAGLPFEALRLAAASVILSPYIPLVFMGEEYGETAPFNYFTSHGDPELGRAVREGRKREFSAFGWEAEPPDPQDYKTFLHSKLNHRLRESAGHGGLFEFYGKLIAIRKKTPALRAASREAMVVSVEKTVIIVIRKYAGEEVFLAAFNFSGERAPAALPEGGWRVILGADAPGAEAFFAQAEGSLVKGGLELQPYGVFLLRKE